MIELGKCFCFALDFEEKNKVAALQNNPSKILQ